VVWCLWQERDALAACDQSVQWKRLGNGTGRWSAPVAPIIKSTCSAEDNENMYTYMKTHSEQLSHYAGFTFGEYKVSHCEVKRVTQLVWRRSQNKCGEGGRRVYFCWGTFNCELDIWWNCEENIFWTIESWLVLLLRQANPISRETGISVCSRQLQMQHCTIVV
jgi:hypothetical protein